MRLLLVAAVLLCSQTAGAPLRFSDNGRSVVAQLSAEIANKLAAGRLDADRGESLLTLSHLADGKTPGPSMLGAYERTGNELIFTPRFPLSPGETYRARLDVAGKVVSLDYTVPKLAAKAPPRLLKIYPTADVLPANHLRFYLYFDRPMRGGVRLFDHIVLLDAKGKEIDAPWLVDEIWDEANNCLILYIHPGRIKWGVELRELMGPVLHDRRSYSLVIRGDWTDLEGNKLGQDIVKKFRTTPEDRTRIFLTDCKVASPKAGTREPLVVTFPKSIDYRSLLTGLTVTDVQGRTVAGSVAAGPVEKTWQFTPTQPWQAGRHRIAVDPDLEDTAGNTPSRPFDRDLVAEAVQPGRTAQSLQLDFEPR